MFDIHTPADLVRKIRDDKIQLIDFRFTDMSGQWWSSLVPRSALDLKSFESVGGFDGSEVGWFRDAQRGGAFVVPDPESAFLDPFAEAPTLVLISNIRDSSAGRCSALDPRSILQRAEAHLQRTHIGGVASFKVELECQGCEEPADLLQQARAQVLETLKKTGVEIQNHAAVGNTAQRHVTMRAAPPTRAADNLMIHAYVVRCIAEHNATEGSRGQALPFAGQSMRVHQNIWCGARPLFAGDGYAGTSAIMRHYMAGLIEHTPVLLDILAPKDRSPALCLGLLLERARRATDFVSISSRGSRTPSVSFFCPGVAFNPYLGFAALLLAGIDGFNYRMYDIDPQEPIDNFVNSRSRAARAAGAHKVDYDFLLADGLFTRDAVALLARDRPRVGEQREVHA